MRIHVPCLMVLWPMSLKMIWHHSSYLVIVVVVVVVVVLVRWLLVQ